MSMSSISFSRGEGRSVMKIDGFSVPHEHAVRFVDFDKGVVNMQAALSYSEKFKTEIAIEIILLTPYLYSSCEMIARREMTAKKFVQAVIGAAYIWLTVQKNAT